MSTSAIQFSEADVDIHNTKKQKKITTRMSTSATQFSEANVDIHNNQKKKLRNGCRHPQHNFLKQMSTSVIQKKTKKNTNRVDIRNTNF